MQHSCHLRPLIIGLVVLSLLTAVSGSGEAQIEVIGGSLAEQRAQPGGQVRGTIVLRNTGSALHEARIYQTDYAFFADGRTVYELAGTSLRSNAKWLSVAPAHIRLEPGQTATVSYTVNVPATGTIPLSGTYWSVVMVEGIVPEPSKAARKADGSVRVQMGMQVAVRYAVQIATHISESPGSILVKFLDPAVVATDSGVKQIRVAVTNAGDLAVRPHVRIEVYNEQGQRVAAVDQQRGLIYPGSSVQQVFMLGQLPAGRYQALIVADTGDEQLFAARFTLKL